MSDTPRTDAFKALLDRPMNWWDFSRELERENAALRAAHEKQIAFLMAENAELREDKERLEWLMSGHVISTVFKFNRAAIDAARREGQP